jgi:hypothetical protein
VDIALWAAIIGAIAVLAAAVLPKIVERIQERRRDTSLRSVSVARIQHHADPDVFRALRLYERRIPATERDDLDNIVRWLQEVQDESRRGVCKLEDYFLVARAGGDLAGFAYIQSYPTASLAFFSYMVVDDFVPEARYCRVSTELLQQTHRLLARSGRCRAVVLEVDEPTVLRGPRARQAAARIRHFKALARMAGCPLKSLSIDYYQPRLAVGQSGEAEVQMRLMYSPFHAARDPRRLHRRDVAEILDFLATCIYGDHFEHNLELDRAYREYLNDWKARMIQAVPEVVELT